MSFLRRLLGKKEERPEDVFHRLRDQAYSVTPQTLRLVATPEQPHVWAALMEWGIDDDVAVVVAMADGAVSFYMSSGFIVIGAGEVESARQAGTAFLDAAEEHRSLLKPARKAALVARDRVRLYVRTFTGDLAADEDESALTDAGHPLTDLFSAAQNVITAVRELTPDDGPPVPDGPPAGTPMTLEVLEPGEKNEKIVARNPDAATIERVVKRLRWDAITFVILKVDEHNWFEGSGSTNGIDGLSAKVTTNGETLVSRRPPESLEEIIALLQSYGAGDDEWREMIEWD